MLAVSLKLYFLQLLLHIHATRYMYLNHSFMEENLTSFLVRSRLVGLGSWFIVFSQSYTIAIHYMTDTQLQKLECFLRRHIYFP